MNLLRMAILAAVLTVLACESETLRPTLDDESAVIFLLNTSDLGQHFFERDIFYRGPRTDNIGANDDDYVMVIDSVHRDVSVQLVDSTYEQGFDSTMGANCDILDEYFGKLNVTTSADSYSKLFRFVLNRKARAIRPLPEGTVFQGWLVRGSSQIRNVSFSPAKVTIEEFTVATKSSSFSPPPDEFPVYRSADLLNIGLGDSVKVTVSAADTLTCYVSFKDSGGIRRFKMDNSAPGEHTVSFFASASPLVNRSIFWIVIEAYGPPLFASSSRVDLSGAVAGIPYKLVE
jgi:hypothetical protein